MSSSSASLAAAPRWRVVITFPFVYLLQRAARGASVDARLDRIAEAAGTILSGGVCATLKERTVDYVYATEAERCKASVLAALTDVQELQAHVVPVRETEGEA